MKTLIFIIIIFCISFLNTIGKDFPYTQDQSLTESKLFDQGTINTRDFELNSAFTPDGKTIFFTRCSPDFKFHAIFISKFINGKWIKPQVAPFSGIYGEGDPFVSHDGKKIFYLSKKKPEGIKKGGYNIWYVERTGDKFSKPIHTGPVINSGPTVFHPTLSLKNTLYFSAIRPGGKGGPDIYYSKFKNGKYLEPVNVGGGVNSSAAEIDACISPDEKFIIFHAVGREKDKRNADLYISFNRNNTWSKAVNLGPKINSREREFCPAISPCGKYFFWTSQKKIKRSRDPKIRKEMSAYSAERRAEERASIINGLGNIYYIDLKEVLKIGETGLQN